MINLSPPEISGPALMLISGPYLSGTDAALYTDVSDLPLRFYRAEATL
jgi:hypothetical protein